MQLAISPTVTIGQRRLGMSSLSGNTCSSPVDRPLQRAPIEHLLAFQM
jgi:hypothetical protein